jgi:hypothetical protein
LSNSSSRPVIILILAFVAEEMHLESIIELWKEYLKEFSESRILESSSRSCSNCGGHGFRVNVYIKTGEKIGEIFVEK